MKKALLIFIFSVVYVFSYSQWQSSTGTTYYDPITTKVGIGINNPSEMLHLNNGAFKIGNTTDVNSRSLNLLKFGDGNNIKIGEWEANDKLSFSARLGFSFSSGFLNLNNSSPGAVIAISSGAGNNTAGQPRLVLHQRADVPHAYVFFNQNLYFHSDGGAGFNPLVLQYDGSVGIGFPEGYTDGINHTGGYKLAVNGSLHARSIDVDLIGWPDFVFSDDYKLKSLAELETFIKENKHLPNIPSQKEVEANGKINLGETQVLLLQKIEELTLYLIDIKKENEELSVRLLQLEAKTKKK